MTPPKKQTINLKDVKNIWDVVALIIFFIQNHFWKAIAIIIIIGIYSMGFSFKTKTIDFIKTPVKMRSME